MPQMASSGQSQPSTPEGLETVVQYFEQAWLRGERPALDDLLAHVDGNHRLPLLVELVHIELEFRLKSGEAARVEEYLQRYPELSQPEIVAALIASEYRQRCLREPGLKWEEYESRFPTLGTVPAPPPVSAIGQFRSAHLGELLPLDSEVSDRPPEKGTLKHRAAPADAQETLPSTVCDVRRITGLRF